MAKKIEGAVRHNGKTYTPGMEKELEKASEGKPLRGFGGRVDSTDAVDTPSRGAARVQELAERRVRAAAEARGEEGEGGEGEEESGDEDEESDSPRRGAGRGQQKNADAKEQAQVLIGTSLADLKTVLGGVADKKTVQTARRMDKRAGAKPLYTARLEEIQSEGGAEEMDAGEVAGESEDAQ